MTIYKLLINFTFWTSFFPKTTAADYLFIVDELTPEADVWANHWPTRAHQVIGVTERSTMVLEQVGKTNRSGSGHSGNTVNEHVASVVNYSVNLNICR